MIFKILASDALVITILGSFLIWFLSVEFKKRKTVTNKITIIKLDINNLKMGWLEIGNDFFIILFFLFSVT